MVIRQTPFQFLKRVAVVTLLFGFAPAALALLLGAEREYQATGLAATFPSFALILLLALVLLQFLVVAVAFATWYFTSYEVTAQEIVHRRGGLSGVATIANTAAIVSVDTHFGPLGRRLDYGDVALTMADQSTAILKNVPGPAHVAVRIESIVDRSVAAALPALQGLTAQELIAGGEHQYVEFKASLMWDYRRQAVNKDLYEPVMKNITAFMNTVGGVVLVGVDDDGQVVGLEKDFSALPKKNIDGWENAFNQAFNRMIGAETRLWVQVEFDQIDGLDLCLVRVQPTLEPVFLIFKGSEEFYIRTGNAAQPLPASKMARYIRTHFQA